MRPPKPKAIQKGIYLFERGEKSPWKGYEVVECSTKDMNHKKPPSGSRQDSLQASGAAAQAVSVLPTADVRQARGKKRPCQSETTTIPSASSTDVFHASVAHKKQKQANRSMATPQKDSTLTISSSTTKDKKLTLQRSRSRIPSTKRSCLSSDTSKTTPKPAKEDSLSQGLPSPNLDSASPSLTTHPASTSIRNTTIDVPINRALDNILDPAQDSLVAAPQNLLQGIQNFSADVNLALTATALAALSPKDAEEWPINLSALRATLIDNHTWVQGLVDKHGERQAWNKILNEIKASVNLVGAAMKRRLHHW